LFKGLASPDGEFVARIRCLVGIWWGLRPAKALKRKTAPVWGLLQKNTKAAVVASVGLAATPRGEAQPAKRGDKKKATGGKGDNCRLTPGEELNVT